MIKDDIEYMVDYDETNSDSILISLFDTKCDARIGIAEFQIWYYSENTDDDYIYDIWDNLTDNDKIFYLANIQIYPMYRNLGYGSILLDYGLDEIQKIDPEINSVLLSIQPFGSGRIKTQNQLKNWYSYFGFDEVISLGNYMLRKL